MKKLTLLLFVALAFASRAQVSHGGSPRFNHAKSAVEAVQLPYVDNQKLLQEDIDMVEGSSPLRVAVMQEAGISNLTQGETTVLGDGTKVWRTAVQSKGATFLALFFSEFDIPDGARIFFYDASGNFILGGFTNENRQNDGTFYTQHIPGDVAYIEYHEPAGAPAGHFLINRVLHGYKGIMDTKEWYDGLGVYPGRSGDCHIDVACDDGDDFRNQIRSVVEMLIVTENGAGFCSGALINNTARDKTPYVLSAYHCQDLKGALVGIVFYFNYQKVTCNAQGGPTNHTVIGAELLAKESPNTGADMLLLRINEPIPDAYKPYYAGWDRLAKERPEIGAGIHHPAGDYKKISIPFTLQKASGWAYFGNHDQEAYKVDLSEYYKATWLHKGIIEEGSSGSPLFNKQKRIIGQLSAGHGDCTNPADAEAYYGRFSSDWIGGGTADSRVSDWLDPLNTGATAIDGIDYTEAVDSNLSIQPNVLYVYPNPSNGMVRVDVEEIGEARYEVYNTQGHLVMQGTTIFAITTQALNLTSLPSGAYIVHLTIGDKHYINTVMIRKR